MRKTYKENRSWAAFICINPARGVYPFLASQLYKSLQTISIQTSIGLTHYQTTKPNKRDCRQQFSVSELERVYILDRKHHKKKRNCLLQVISPFAT